VQTVQLAPVNNQSHRGASGFSDDEDEEDDGMQEDMVDYAELEYFCQAAGVVAAQGVKNTSQTTLANKSFKAATSSGTADDFIGLDAAAEEQKNNTGAGAGAVGGEDGEDEMGQIDKLREENKRLKKTLLEKFQSEADV